jgi:hypothetical protein
VEEYVFVSYSRDDQSYVEKLIKHLKEAGVTAWIDKTGIDYGSEWHRVIEDKLGSSGAVVVVMTPAGWASEWVGMEIQQAKDERKPILPLLVSGKRFMTLNTRQYEDVTGGKMPSVRWLEQLRKLLG